MSSDVAKMDNFTLSYVFSCESVHGLGKKMMEEDMKHLQLRKENNFEASPRLANQSTNQCLVYPNTESL